MADLKISQLTNTTDPDGLYVPGERAGQNYKFDLGTIETLISDHIADTTGAHAASAISFTPIGDIAATNVADALEELDVDKASLTYVDAKVIDSIVDGDTGHAPSGNSVFDAFAARAKDIIICGAAATTLVDSTLYYYGQIFSLALQTSTDTTFFTPSVSGTIKTAVIRIRQAVNGSNEAVALDLKQGSNFNTIKSDIDHSFGANTSRTYLVTGLNISVVAGTNYELRLTVPNMTTNPTNVVYGTTLYIF